jgi:hypothetical protein
VAVKAAVKAAVAIAVEEAAAATAAAVKAMAVTVEVHLAVVEVKALALTVAAMLAHREEALEMPPVLLVAAMLLMAVAELEVARPGVVKQPEAIRLAAHPVEAKVEMKPILLMKQIPLMAVKRTKRTQAMKLIPLTMGSQQTRVPGLTLVLARLPELELEQAPVPEQPPILAPEPEQAQVLAAALPVASKNIPGWGGKTRPIRSHFINQFPDTIRGLEKKRASRFR